MAIFIDLTGNKYNRLTVIRRLDNKKRATIWLCRCDCGNRVDVFAQHLKNGHTKSCGCFKIEKVTKYGHTTHKTKSKIYGKWVDMHQRCNNSNHKHYKSYGGRGITVCERWSKFENFLEDMGIPKNKDELDRVDVDSNYEPNNCKWSTRREQCRNKRNTLYVNYKGESIKLISLAEKYNIQYHRLYNRVVRQSMSIDNALSLN